MWIKTWQIVLLLLSHLTVYILSTECPNDQFKFVARWRQTFKLDPKHKLYWLAFGQSGKWVIHLVDANVKIQDKNSKDLHDHQQTFKCKENYLLSVTTINTETDGPICCAAPHAIDNEEKTNPFAVLPRCYFKAIQDYEEDGARKETRHLPNGERYGDDQIQYFYWMARLTTDAGTESKNIFQKIKGNSMRFWTLGIYAMSKSKYKQWTMFRDTTIAFPLLKKNKASTCGFSSELENCDTGITNDIVVFQVDCDGYSFIRFAFSADGVFKKDPLLYLFTSK